MSEESREPIIQLIDVCKSFGDQSVLENVNLDIFEGTTTVIIGPSGTGKSVILKQMMGLLKPTSGRVLVFGQDLSRISKRELQAIRMNFGVLFQNVALFDSMNVFDNVALPLRERTKASEKEIRQNVEEKLALMDLDGVNEKYPAQLSGGMLKRVGLARALVLNPKVIFFDEPTTGLDINKSNEIYRVFYRSQLRFKYTSVIVSHDVPRIFKLTDYVALLADRTIVNSISPEDFQLSKHPAIKSFVETTMGPIYISEEEEADYYEKI
ncbi:MAG: ATP-binding cassette domain-containing protein [bacterium]|nr:MAG: ATP-binding cassette domain-containing protein [bacterium]